MTNIYQVLEFNLVLPSLKQLKSQLKNSNAEISRYLEIKSNIALPHRKRSEKKMATSLQASKIYMHQPSICIHCIRTCIGKIQEHFLLWVSVKITVSEIQWWPSMQWVPSTLMGAREFHSMLHKQTPVVEILLQIHDQNCYESKPPWKTDNWLFSSETSILNCPQNNLLSVYFLNGNMTPTCNHVVATRSTFQPCHGLLSPNTIVWHKYL